jgi:hypothetical protein
VEARCEECGEPAVESPPTSWDPSWGTVPEWSHEDGEPLCPSEGLNGEDRAGTVIFI